MELLGWLCALQANIRFIGKDHAMREFVTGLHKRGQMYHFDDDAHETLVHNDGTWVPAFTTGEANLLNAIVKELYCDEMFDLAMQLSDEDGKDEAKD